MSPIQTSKLNICKQVMNIPTNSVEMILSMLWTHQEKNEIN
jgi:hypothetical protein